MTARSDPNLIEPERSEESQNNYDQILFPAVYELHRRGYDIQSISTEDEWEISITFDKIYHFSSLPSEQWMQCGQDLVYRHTPDADRYDRKYGAFEVFGLACTLPPIPRPAPVEDLYHGILEALLQSGAGYHTGIDDPRRITNNDTFPRWGQ